MIRVRAPSRLHFGLLNPFAGTGSETRRFGGAGLMIDTPSIVVRAEPAQALSAEGPLAERARAFARHYLRNRPVGCQLTIEAAAPEHAGLGTGTQLGLAVATAVDAVQGMPRRPASELAAEVGRGLRSAIGVHGFDRGGFIIETGKLPGEGISPLLVHALVPASWRIVVFLPASTPGMHGAAERAVFEHLAPSNPDDIEALYRLAVDGMLPALRRCDIRQFGEAVHEYNARAGDFFAAAQGGRYSGPIVAGLVELLRQRGIAGVGQSSWGPAVFAIVEHADRAAWIDREVRSRSAVLASWIATASVGAVIEPIVPGMP